MSWDEGHWVGEHLTEKPGQGEDRKSRHPDEGVYLAEGECLCEYHRRQVVTLRSLLRQQMQLPSAQSLAETTLLVKTQELRGSSARLNRKGRQ